MTKPTILTLIGHYLPGFKAGGPIRTIANMMDQLGDDVNFRIITADRDFQDKVPYSDVTIDDWNTVGKAQVFYASPSNLSFRKLGRLLRDTRYDLLYLNSFFNPMFSIRPMLLHKLRLVPEKPIVLAPRGEFSRGALALKATKKRSFMGVAKILRLYEGITWHASTEMEKDDIERCFSYRSKQSDANCVLIAPNCVQIALDLSSKCSVSQDEAATVSKEVGSLRLVFLSRISAMKNLDYALNVLKGVRGDISFDLYGPVDGDAEYWEVCKRLISEMPDNITVQYKGMVDHAKVRSIFAQYHAFLLPSRGENFGHVIMESLSAGCPVIVSDKTPWKGLAEKQAGWDIPLSQPEEFQAVLEQLVAMDGDQWKIHAQHATQHAIEAADNQEVLEQNRRLFLQAY